jgi:hypothetical protein
MPSRNVTYLQVVKGKRQMKLACGEVKYRERKTEKQYQLTGIRDGRGDIRIGALRHLKILAVRLIFSLPRGRMMSLDCI